MTHGADHCQLSVIIPTFNEAGNLPILVERLAAILGEQDYELVVVDDNSPDGTWRIAEELSARYPVRVFRRVDRRGLSSAVVDGLTAARGHALVVIDADLQHDPAIIPALVAGLAEHEVAVGTRYAEGGSTGTWGGSRLALSRAMTWGVRKLLGVPTSDPMSGFFAIRRTSFQRIHPLLRPRGYKILLEILHRGHVASVHHEAYVFATRQHGESKLGPGVLVDCAAALWDMHLGEVLPLRFVKYCMIGSVGVAVQLIALDWLRMIPALRSNDAPAASALAIAVAIFTNYVLNDLWTFRGLRLRNFRGWWSGLLRFYLVCATGALISFSIGQGLVKVTDEHMNIYFASGFGVLVATVWNYVLNRRFTWKG